MYSNHDQLFYLSAIEIRAAKAVYFKFLINRHELSTLCSISACLQLLGRRTVSRKIFTDWLGLSYVLEKKMNGYLEGLHRQGMIHRLRFRSTKTGNVLAISGYGIRVLEYFYDEVQKIDRQDKERKKKPGYKTLAMDANVLPKGYSLLNAGRDD